MNKVEPVRKEVIVEASRERCFKIFTEGVDRWWPRQHHIGKSPLKEARLESKPGGRWYSVCEDGSEVNVGRVLLWEPPARLVLSWQITGEWKFDPDFMTEVEARFVEEGPKRTRVFLEHRDLERYGEATESIRKSIDSPGGWGFIMEQFAKAAEKSESA